MIIQIIIITSSVLGDRQSLRSHQKILHNTTPIAEGRIAKSPSRVRVGSKGKIIGTCQSDSLLCSDCVDISQFVSLDKVVLLLCGFKYPYLLIALTHSESKSQSCLLQGSFSLDVLLIRVGLLASVVVGYGSIRLL